MGRDITVCHPRLQRLASKLKSECINAGLSIGIGECFRSVAEQDALYAQGRTEPGSIVTNARGSSYSSQHQWGIAFDFYRDDGKGAYNESGNFFGRVGEIGKSLGLGWGGDWTSIVDKPHFYLPDWGSGTGILKERYGTFEKFRATWNDYDPSRIEALTPVSAASTGLRVTASSLVIRDMPAGKDTEKRYKRDAIIGSVTEKCFVDGDPWIHTPDGWVSAYYIEGWLLQDGRWWYVEPGYTWPAEVVKEINWKWYAFDCDGWMIEAKNIQPDGSIQ